MIADIINQQDDYKIPTTFLQKNVKGLLKATRSLKISNKALNKKLSTIDKLNINLVFVTAEHIKSLNSDFRSKNKPTDVLSFSSFDPECLGELIFCPEVIVANAKDNKWAQKYEYLYMLVHGYLHLLGLDHEVESEAKAMFSLQDQIFNKLSPKEKVILKK